MKHLVDGIKSGGLVEGDNNALASCQAVGFDHNWRTLGADIVFGGFGLGKVSISRSGSICSVTNLFGEIFATFKGSGGS